MDPITQMLLSQLIPTGINAAQAISQKKKGNEFSKIQRPQYNIPQSVLDQVNQAKYLASMRELPGQNLMEGRLGQNTAKGIAEMKNVVANPADLASNVAKMYGAQNDAMNNIGMQAGQNWLGQQGRLNQVLGNLGQYQDKQWDYNVNQPYQDSMAASSALREGAFRNAMAAGANIASALGGTANIKWQQDQLNKLMGGGPSVFGGNSGTAMPNMPTVQPPASGGFDRKTLGVPRTISLPQAINSINPVQPITPASQTPATTTVGLLKPINQMTPSELNAEYNALMSKSTTRTPEEEERFYELTQAIYR
jgi:hypothetical protein